MLIADARSLPIASGTVQACVTSPPYWGLRTYDGGSMEIGQEPHFNEYVAAIVQAFREVHRVLRNDGAAWLNVADTYAGKQSTGYGVESSGLRTGRLYAGDHAAQLARTVGNRNTVVAGVKPKDLCLIPARIALALQADGWWIRRDQIWHKPNPPTQSAKDRPTSAHEYVFLLTKSRRYYYDAEAIAELLADSTKKEMERAYRGQARKDYAAGGAQNPSETKRRIVAGLRKKHGVRPFDNKGGNQGNGCIVFGGKGTRNAHSVWTIPTQPYGGEHFATMPEALAEKLVLSISRPGDWVIDPFLGSGTTARVAISLGRRAVGCDLQPKYLRLQRERMTVTRGLPLEMGRPA